VNTTDQNNCASSASITLNAKPTFSLTVSANKTTITTGDPVQLTATGADSYVWSPSLSLDNPNIANPVAKPSVTTTYQVTGTKSGFCDAHDSVMVNVIASGAVTIKPPVILSPNGDGGNDTWIIPDVENNAAYSDCTMTIYDGHGSKVYETKGYNSGNRWDGTYNGRSVPDGTYFYVFGCPNLRPATGSVLVVK
jgi:gliding motility-associated-like protein